MADKVPVWLDEGDGSLVALDDATPYFHGNIRIVIGRRVYERKTKHSDGKWIFVYHMTEPA
jgi:hypothetical protein